MRLYKLLQRRGLVRKGVSPFVQEPVIDGVSKFAGWRWDTAKEEWTKVPLEKIKVSIRQPSYPMPDMPPRPEIGTWVPGWMWTGRDGEWRESPMTPQEISEGVERGPKPVWPPGPARPDRVMGWEWNYRVNEWMAILYATQVHEVSPPHLLPPGTKVTEAMALGAGQTQLTLMIDKFIEMGVPLDQAFDLATRINTVTVRHMVVSPTGEYKRLWDGYANVIGKQPPTFFQQIAVAVILVKMADELRAMIDAIGEGLMWPVSKWIAMVPPVTTYLMGPDEWFYADIVSVSVKGVPYYTACETIGAENAEHLRGYPGAWDRIAFAPDGFLEKGWKAGLFVRYRWSYWEVLYIGFLIRSGENFYRLQEGYRDIPLPREPYLKEAKLVCSQEFKYYL